MIEFQGKVRDTNVINGKELTNMVEVRMWERLPMECNGVHQVDNIDPVFCRNGEHIRIFGVPLHCANSIARIRGRRNAEQQTSAKGSRKTD